MNTSEHKQKIESFTDLEAWKIGHKLVIDIYHATDTFPSREQFSLTSQMRRCAVSITSNVAEGFSRRTRKDKIQFYTVAIGSLTELQNQLLVAKDVNFISDELFRGLSDKTIHIHKLLSGLLKSAHNKKETA